MNKERKLSENIGHVLRDGPRMRIGQHTWIVAKDPDQGFHICGGLGCMGVGQMWVKTDDDDRGDPEYADAPLAKCQGRPF